MKEAKSRTESKDSGRVNSEFGAVTIDFNPAPDAEDRLRRLFTILVRLADDDLPSLGTESQTDKGGEEEH